MPARQAGDPRRQGADTVSVGVIDTEFASIDLSEGSAQVDLAIGNRVEGKKPTMMYAQARAADFYRQRERTASTKAGAWASTTERHAIAFTTTRSTDQHREGDSMHTHDAIIIGSGQAGPFLAVRLAQSGMKVALVAWVNKACVFGVITRFGFGD